MKNMKKILLVSILMSVGFGFSKAQDSLTVKEVVRQVLRNHPAIVQAEQQVQASEARVGQASSASYPQADIEASYTRLGPSIPFFFGPLGPFQFFPVNNYDAHIGAGYTLYDFGRRSAAVEVAQSRVQSAQNAVGLTKTGLRYQAIRTFNTILFLHKSIQVADEQIRTLSEHLSLAKKKVEAGSATNLDVLTTEVRVASAETQKVDLENSLRQQESMMRQLLGEKEGMPVELAGEFSMIPVPLNTDSLVRSALAQREEMKLARDALASANLQYRLASRGNLPSLHVSASFGAKNGLYLPDLDIIRGNWALGAQVTVPVFDGFRVHHQEEEAQAAILAEQAHVQNTERQIRAEVERAVDNIKTSLEKLRISRVQVAQAHEAVSVARTRYETGSATNVDLLDAETAESAAKLGNVQALFGYVMSRNALEQAVGLSNEGGYEQRQ
jgi:outer membrane protein